jgi:hypothetical protein
VIDCVGLLTNHVAVYVRRWESGLAVCRAYFSLLQVTEIPDDDREILFLAAYPPLHVDVLVGGRQVSVGVGYEIVFFRRLPFLRSMKNALVVEIWDV